MKEKNSDISTVACSKSRTDSDVTLKFNPSSYNHHYKLIKIDTTSVSDLFKTPAYPGDHYQMKVDLYTSSNLIESMMVNLTTVYGDLLTYPDIEFKIPGDAEEQGIFEFTFKVGTHSILPAYDNSEYNLITSAI